MGIVSIRIESMGLIIYGEYQLWEISVCELSVWELSGLGIEINKINSQRNHFIGLKFE